jgi:hypothetical protein
MIDSQLKEHLDKDADQFGRTIASSSTATAAAAATTLGLPAADPRQGNRCADDHWQKDEHRGHDDEINAPQAARSRVRCSFGGVHGFTPEW